ncbi:hypothetical protein AB0E25_12775 [Streptomyces bobili]|uniref:hypothetical protein n=1 Tax=Streptomyces bobili TaxID=67280 RepID=UPI0033E5EF50
MRKTVIDGLPAVTALTTSTPALAADDGGSFGGGVNAADNSNFTAAAVCLQEVAVVPVLGDWVGDHVNTCSNGNVVDQASDAVRSLAP